ncbi:MAG TPA: YihY/virulence factor BrkB family protein, partial [Vicinamibacterales bacterium]|nr:YihY/virulence factor BrkB family protein [Vicinamibacterales bacterium]
SDNALGLAAQLAFYFLLALVPAIAFVVAVASFFPPRLLDDMLSSLGGLAPPAVVTILREQLDSLAGGSNGGILTIGLAMALWSSSAAIVSIIDAMNRAYDIDEGRPWWKVRLTAIALTVGLALFVVVAFALVMAGPGIADRLVSGGQLGSAFASIWKILQWPIVLALIAVAMACINYFAPDAEQDWVWVTPGAVLATILWLLASLAFKVYLANFADYNATYGSLGGVVILMLWFYISGLAILVGAEMNAEIEHASPHGKDPGEKVPGQKKKLGPAAARDWERRNRITLPRPSVPPAASSPALRTETYTGAMIYGLTRLFRRVKN